MSRLSPWRLMCRFKAWFSAPGSPVPAGWFRIGIALFCLLKLWVVRQSILDLYGQYGFIQWAITRGNLTESLPHLGNLALLLRRVGLSADQSVYVVVGAYVTALVLLLAGVAARWMAGLAWGMNLLLMHSGAGLLYGMDYFTHIGLFYCLIMPSGEAVSLPAFLSRRTPTPSVAAGVTRKMMQLQLCIVYASSGIEKASGIQWWNGEAIWRSLTLPVFGRFDFSWLPHVPWMAAVAGWSVLVIECGYAFMVWNKRTRGLWIVLTLGMHFGIGLFMGMWLFALVMMLLSTGAFGYEVWNDWACVRKQQVEISGRDPALLSSP